MTTAQLLMPRYIVTGLWPGCNYNIGDIFNLKYDHYFNNNIYPPDPDMCESVFKQYPHLFRLLHWSEYREVDQMPEYVKVNASCNPYNGEVFKLEDISGYFLSFPNEFMPATHEEYIQYQQTKQ